MAKNAEIKLSVRLSTQSRFTGTAYETGINLEDTSDRDGAGAVELINPEPAELELVKAAVSAESWREMRARKMFEASPGSCCNHV